MSKVIYKYKITGDPIEMPKGADIIHVGMQNQEAFLWAMFFANNADDKEQRKIDIYGTGQKIPADRKYIGTFMDGPFVWHVHENINGEKINV